MADVVFNVAKGRGIEFHERVVNNDGANSALVVCLFQVIEADATIIDYDDLATLIAAAGNTEATFTNYARKVLTDAELTAATLDDANDRYDADMPNQVWSSAGGTVDNSLAKLIVGFDNDTTAGTDTNIIPIAAYDFVVSTNGGDLTANVNAAGYLRGT